MQPSLRCHCDSAAAPGNLNRMGVGKHASGGPTWLGPASGTKERSGGSTRHGGTSEPCGMLTHAVGGVQLPRQMAQLNMKAGVGAKLYDFSISLSL